MFKQPVGSVYMININNYLFFIPAPFSRDLKVDLEGSSTFLPFTLSMHIHRLGLLNHLIECLFNCNTMGQGSWAVTIAFCIEVG